MNTLKYLFKLYLSGESTRNTRILKNLKSILNDNFEDDYSLEVINVTKNPELADRPNVFATPMLIKQLPPPSTMIVGNFADKEKLSRAVYTLTDEDL